MVNGGQNDIQRLENAVTTTEHLVPAMNMLMDTMRSIGGNIADLGTRIDGDVGNVAVQAELKALHDKTENTMNAMETVISTNKVQAGSMVQNLVDKMKEMERAMKDTDAKVIARDADLRA